MIIVFGAILLLMILVPSCQGHRTHSKKHHSIREVSRIPEEGSYYQLQEGPDGQKEIVLIVPKKRNPRQFKR
jgi:hypothetical protein